jgi:hypothetical protein
VNFVSMMEWLRRFFLCKMDSVVNSEIRNGGSTSLCKENLTFES